MSILTVGGEPATPTPSPNRPPPTTEQELVALRTVANALELLDEGAEQRVLGWVHARFRPGVSARA